MIKKFVCMRYEPLPLICASYSSRGCGAFSDWSLGGRSSIHNALWFTELITHCTTIGVSSQDRKFKLKGGWYRFWRNQVWPKINHFYFCVWLCSCTGSTCYIIHLCLCAYTDVMLVYRIGTETICHMKYEILICDQPTPTTVPPRLPTTNSKLIFLQN